ncbi:70 kDa peptidyl-prolyl isomerase, partial [Bienertia sinuspersici]
SIKNCLDFQEDLKGLLFYGSNLENEDSDLFGFISNLENPKGVLENSRNLEDEGNISFKEGDFDIALEKYSLSCVFLSCLALQKEDARSSFSQLASSVVLNMAASLLKKKEFEHVGQLCSIVLNYNPNNVKALFRRANAAIGLGKYELASWNLRVALEVEPSNQEVVRKLKEVEQITHSIPKNSHGQGKKKQEECGSIDPINVSMGNERDSNQYERENFISNDLDDCNMTEVEKSDERDSVMKIDSVGWKSKTEEVDMSEKENDKEVGEERIASKKKVDKSKYHFQNKRQPQPALVISRSDYQRLVKGRTIQHFNSRSGIVMSIWVIGTPHDTSKKISDNHTQQNFQSPPRKQGEHIHLKGVADNITHIATDKAEQSLLREASSPGPKKAKMDQPPEVISMLTDCPSYATSLDRSPPCFHSLGIGSNSSLFLQSITTGNRSRRRRKRGLVKGVTKGRRINRRISTCVLSDHNFQCRSKIEASTKHRDQIPPDSQNLSKFRSGMKRKFVLLQSPDSPQQTKKLLIIKNDNCSRCAGTLCSFSFDLCVVAVVQKNAPLPIPSPLGSPSVKKKKELKSKVGISQ